MNHRVTILLLLGTLSTGCYTRAPLEAPAPAPSTRIVATVTDQGAVALGNSLGAGAMEVEGVVTTATEDEWTLQMLRVRHRDGRSVGWNREVVSFSRVTLANPTVVVLDKPRSWLAAGTITIGAVVLARVFHLLGGGDDNGRDGGGDPPQGIRVPADRSR